MESDGTYMSDHQLFFLSDSYPKRQLLIICFCGLLSILHVTYSPKVCSRFQIYFPRNSYLLVPIFGQDNGFLLVIDGVRKEKERLTAAKLLHGPSFLLFIGSCLSDRSSGQVFIHSRNSSFFIFSTLFPLNTCSNALESILFKFKL